MICFQIEAFFYGLAGLLEETFLKRNRKTSIVSVFVRSSVICSGSLKSGRGWTLRYGVFYGFVRKNFPHIRLAQLAYLYQKGDKLFSRLLEAETLVDVRNLLDARTSPYWENHYLFGRPSSQKEKTMGERSRI